MNEKQLIDLIKPHYQLDFWNGLHGLEHWRRVRDNGLLMAEKNGANPAIIQYFAFFHDCMRENDHYDDGHGERAVDFIEMIPDCDLNLTESEAHSLCYACRTHTDGLIEAPNIDVATCWDSDRLDLGRVGVKPITRLLCTTEAKDASFLEERYLVGYNASKKHSLTE